MSFAESESDLKHSWNVGERERSSWMCDFLWCSEKKGQANKLKLANTGRSLAPDWQSLVVTNLSQIDRAVL